MLDLLLYNGVVQSMDSAETVYEAIGMLGDRIAFLGSNEGAVAVEARQRIDLKGKLVLPGFADTHLHILETMVSVMTVSLAGCASPEEIVAKGRAFAEAHGPYRGWLLGRGWNQNGFEGEKVFITRAQLDQISTELPVVYSRVCGHIAVANTEALKRILAMEEASSYVDWIDPETGVLLENAAFLHQLLMDPLTEEGIMHLMTLGQAALNREGITSIHSTDFMGMPEGVWQLAVKAFEKMQAQGDLTVRLYEQCYFNRLEEFRQFLEVGYKTGFGGEYFRIGPLKLFADGSLGARTALLRAPYCDAPETMGVQTLETQTLRAYLELADRHEMQTAIHAIGDGAIAVVTALLETLIENRRIQGGDLNPLRHGIVHAQLTSPDLLARMAQAGIVAYIQPVFVPSDMGIVEDRIGPERMKQVYAWKTMRNLGIRAAGGSDAPVERFSILENLHAAVMRTDLQGQPEGGWLPEEKLTLMEGLRLFTSEAAYLSFDEDRLGTLELGKLADLAVLDRNLFALSGQALLEAQVAMTVTGGRVVFERL